MKKKETIEKIKTKSAVKPKKQDTKLESEGAEFLVLGLLLIEGIASYKAYINFPGYDLTAVNPETKRVARIQVKSRWATDYDTSFPLKKLGNTKKISRKKVVMIVEPYKKYKAM